MIHRLAVLREAAYIAKTDCMKKNNKMTLAAEVSKYEIECAVSPFRVANKLPDKWMIQRCISVVQ